VAFSPQAVDVAAPSLWRYRAVLPIAEDRHIVSLGEGFTPLIREKVGGVDVHLKLDFLFPSGSFKDRGATVLVSHVRELGVAHVVEDSSGNAGAAIAAYGARAGIACDIYVPASTSTAQLAQIESTGAKLVRVPGSREDTAKAALAAAAESYYASHSWNPFFLAGTKTFAYEVCEQLGWQSPDVVLIPTGNGTLLLGAARGFAELRAAGVIDREPQLLAVQVEACAPVYRAFHSPSQWPMANGQWPMANGYPQPTLASGLAIAEPIRLAQMVDTLRGNGGTVLTVREEAICTARRDLARRGLYVEPTGAAAVAGVPVAIAQGLVTPGEVIVAPLTGSGLKGGAR